MRKLFIAMGLAVLAVIGVGLVWYYYVPIHTAKEAVKLKLRDPESAQFRNVRKVNPVVGGKAPREKACRYQ